VLEACPRIEGWFQQLADERYDLLPAGRRALESYAEAVEHFRAAVEDAGPRP